MTARVTEKDPNCIPQFLEIFDLKTIEHLSELQSEKNKTKRSRNSFSSVAKILQFDFLFSVCMRARHERKLVFN